MESLMIQLLESKGLEIPGKDYDVLNERWNNLQKKKPELDLTANGDVPIDINGGD